MKPYHPIFHVYTNLGNVVPAALKTLMGYRCWCIVYTVLYQSVHTLCSPYVSARLCLVFRVETLSTLPLSGASYKLECRQPSHHPAKHCTASNNKNSSSIYSITNNSSSITSSINNNTSGHMNKINSSSGHNNSPRAQTRFRPGDQCRKHPLKM